MNQDVQLTSWQLYKSLALPVYLPSFLMSVCQGAILLTIPLYALELGANAGIASLVFAIRGLGNMAMDIPAGFATARLGDKTTMLSGIGVMALTGFVASQSESTLQLSFAAFFFGTAMAGWLLARLSHISDVVPLSHRGRAISTMAGLQRFGNLIGPVLTGIIAQQMGFGAVFVCIGVLALTAFLLISFKVKSNRKGSHEESPDIVRLVPHIVSRHHKIFMTAGVAILFLTVIRAGRQLLIPLWGKHIGLDITDIGFIVGLSSAIDMSLFPLAGYLMDRKGRKYSAVFCLSLLSIGLAFIPFSSTFLTLMLASMLTGAGNGLGSGINMTLGADFAPDHERGEFLGVWRLISDMGSFAGPVFMGYIAQSFLLSTAFFATTAMGLAGAVIMLAFVKETLKPEHPP